MRTDQFLRSLTHLKLMRASTHTADALGLSLRQLQRISAGKAAVPRPVALLMIGYLKHGLPDPLWNPDADRENHLARVYEATIGRLLPNRGKAQPNPASSVISEVVQPTQPTSDELIAASRRQKAEREQERMARVLERTARTRQRRR